MPDDACTFERHQDMDVTNPTLVEGFPGLGLVASIAVDHLTMELDLDHVGDIVGPELPPVVTFEDGRMDELVRLYAGRDPEVLTVRSALPLPDVAFRPVARCVVEDVAPALSRLILLTGAPAEREEEIGDVSGIATDDVTRRALDDVGIPEAEGPGVVAGVTGAVARAAQRRDVPTAVVVVKAHPQLPDPTAAKAVVEKALMPLLGVDVDTKALEEKAEEIRQRKQEVARELQQLTGGRGDLPGPGDPVTSMFR